jgi:hypothetical protein
VDGEAPRVADIGDVIEKLERVDEPPTGRPMSNEFFLQGRQKNLSLPNHQPPRAEP